MVNGFFCTKRVKSTKTKASVREMDELSRGYFESNLAYSRSIAHRKRSGAAIATHFSWVTQHESKIVGEDR